MAGGDLNGIGFWFFLVRIVQARCTRYFRRSISLTLANGAVVENLLVFSILQTGEWPSQWWVGTEPDPGLLMAISLRSIWVCKGLWCNCSCGPEAPAFNETGDSAALSRRHPGVDVAAWTQAAHQAWRVIEGPGARGRGQGSRMSSPEEPRGEPARGARVAEAGDQRASSKRPPTPCSRHIPSPCLGPFFPFFSKQKQSLSCDDFNHSIAIPFLMEFDIVAP